MTDQATGGQGAGERLAVFTGGILADSNAKTGHGVLRYGAREVVCVVDAAFAGRRADEVVPFVRREVPVVATVAEAAGLGATTLLIGVAPSGGKLEPAWQQALLEAVRLGLAIEAGLHSLLVDDPELAAAAAATGVEVRDLRRSPSDLNVPAGVAVRPEGTLVVHTVGTDCAIGKMSVVLELESELRGRGEDAVFVATGQTGIAISGWGIAVDHVISDYIAGAAARLVREGAERGSLLLIEGQGSLYHPAYSGVTLGLLHGSAPDVLILAHRAGRTTVEDYDVVLPRLDEVVRLYEAACAAVRPARVCAVAVNTAGLEDDEAAAVIAAAAEESGLPAFDAVRGGAGGLADVVLAALGR